eukprot:542250-Alexandrium_andersonii.AAC.1
MSKMHGVCRSNVHVGKTAFVELSNSQNTIFPQRPVVLVNVFLLAVLLNDDSPLKGSLGVLNPWRNH